MTGSIVVLADVRDVEPGRGEADVRVVVAVERQHVGSLLHEEVA